MSPCRQRIREFFNRLTLPKWLQVTKRARPERPPAEIQMIGLGELNEELGATRPGKSWPNGADYESSKTDLTEIESSGSRLVVYYASILPPFYGGLTEPYHLNNFHHSPRIEDYLLTEVAMGRANQIRQLIIDGSNEQLQRKRVRLNDRFDQLVHLEARFINFEEYQFLASPNINRIFLDSVYFGKLEPDEPLTDQFESYPEAFALLPKSQIAAFASYDSLDEEFFRYAMDNQILDQVETLDRVHLNAAVGAPQAHHIITLLADRDRFPKLRRLNVHIGKSVVQFLGYLEGFRSELLRACCLFVQWKGTLKLFGIPIVRHHEVEPTVEFIEQLFRLLKNRHMIEMNPTFIYFAVTKKTQSLLNRLSSAVRPEYQQLIKRFYSNVEVLQCLDIKDRAIFENFQNVWGVSIRLSSGLFSTAKSRNKSYAKFFSQFKNCNSRVYSLVVASQMMNVGNLFLDRLPRNFPNLSCLKVKTKKMIDFDFIYQMPYLSSLNLVLDQMVGEATFFCLVRSLTRLMYLRVLSVKGEYGYDRDSLNQFKENVDRVLHQLGRGYLVFSYKLVAGQNTIQRLVKPAEEGGKSAKEAAKLIEQAAGTSNEGARKSTKKAAKSTVIAEKSTEEAAKSTEEAAKPTEEAAKSTEVVEKPTEDAAKSTEGAEKPVDEAGGPTEEPEKSTEDSVKPAEDAGKSTEGAEKPVDQVEESIDEARGPSVEAGEPTVEAGEPTVEAEESSKESGKPTEEASKSTEDAGKSIDEVGEVTAEVRKLIEEFGKPADDVSKRTEESSKQTEKASERAEESSNLTEETRKPVDEASKSSDEEYKSLEDAGQPTDEASKSNDEEETGKPSDEDSEIDDEVRRIAEDIGL